MAEPDRVTRAADTLKKMAEEVEETLVRDGFKDYPAKPSDRDFRKGYSTACREAERALRE